MVVRELLQALIDVAVAVVVVAVARLRRVRRNRGVGVVTVFARRGAIPVGIAVSGAPIAVVVVGVRAVVLEGAGVVGCVGVVAVVVLVGVPGGRVARDVGDVGATVPVGVGVGVPHGGVDGITPVSGPAAVVVDRIEADLDTAGAHATIGIVAVFAGRVPIAVGVDTRGGAVAVEIDEIGAGLGRAGVDGDVGVVAVVAAARGVGVPVTVDVGTGPGVRIGVRVAVGVGIRIDVGVAGVAPGLPLAFRHLQLREAAEKKEEGEEGVTEREGGHGASSGVNG